MFGDQLCGSRKVKVTILASEWGSRKGGLSTINRELALQLAKCPEVEITLFLPQCSQEDRKVALQNNVKIVEATPLPGLEQLEWLSFPPDHLQIDIIVGHGVTLGKQAQIIKKSKKCRWLQVVHTDPEELGMFKNYSNPISKGEEKHKTEVELCKMADHVLGVGPKLSEAFRSYLRSCKKDDTVLDFTPGVFEEFTALKQVPSERQQCSVLVFGRGDVEDFELKGFDIAGKAVAALEGTCLVFVGAPYGKQKEIAKRLTECGVPPRRLRVRGFVKKRESLKDLFQEVDLVIMPSRTEGFGLTGLEALSAGLPVLVSGNSGFGEALCSVPFGSTYVVNSDEPADWTSAIKNIWAKDRKSRLEEAEMLRDSFDKKYNWARQIKDLIEKMISWVYDDSSNHQGYSETKHRKVSQQMEGITESIEVQNILPSLQNVQCDADQVYNKTIVPSNLRTVAAKKGFLVSNNQASGNCLFYALSEQLKTVKGIQISHKELRNTLVQFLRENANLPDGTSLLNFVSGYPSWHEYLQSMAKEGTWGDHVVLFAAANYFQTAIRIINSLDREIVVHPEHAVADPTPLVLGHIHELYYVSLQPRKGSAELTAHAVCQVTRKNEKDWGSTEIMKIQQEPKEGMQALALVPVTSPWRTSVTTEPSERPETQASNRDSNDDERDCDSNKPKGHSESPRQMQQETNEDMSKEPSTSSGPGDSRGDLWSAVSGYSSFLSKEVTSLHPESCPKAEGVVTLKYPYPRGIAESSTYEKERVHSEWGKNQSSSVENKADDIVQSTRYVDMEIRKLPSDILKKLSDQLDIDGPRDWKALISVMPTGMYSEEQVTSFENQRARMDGSPSMALLTDLGQRAKTVRQLVVWLKKIGNCQALDTLEYKEKSDAVDLEVLPPTFTTSEGVFKEESIEGIFTSEGGVMAEGNIRLVCPPGALDDSLSVTITLEDPSKYYSLIVQKDLENDVIIAAPIVNLQPNGHSFRKPIKLTTSFKNMNWKWHGDDVFILHGTEARDGKVTWQDITKSSKINEAAGEVEVELKHFSLIMVLLRWTLIRSKDILSRFDLLSFDYTLLVLLNKTSPSSAHDMLALLFVSQDVYHEQFYREDETSALVQLKKEGFIEVHERATDRLDKKRIYNHENLQISIQLGEDYRLSDSQHRSFSFGVDSFVWWNGGKVIKIPLEWRNEVRYLCGTISVNGENGHASKKHFSEADLCNYVRKLLGMEGNIFNVITIARLLEMPEELMHQVTSSWEDDCEQLNLSLQHWSEKSAGVENLSSLRKCLEGINQEEYNVTSRGQMHIRRLRKLATKITDLQLVNTDLVRYFSRKATILCNSVLRDCCLELNQDKASSSSNNADPLVKQFIENRPSHPMPDDISTKYRLVCSPSDESRTSIFLAIVPHLIQTIKEIFVDHKRLVPHSGLIGLQEDNVNQLLTSVLNARQNNRFRDLVYVECQILEKLCLKNRSKKPVAEITKWSESLAIEQMLNFLERFFKHCLHDIRLHRRLEIFSRRLRDTLLTDDKEVDEDYMQDFANILLSLVDFAKFDPSKLVRFELIDSKNSTLSSTSSDVENVVHDEHDDTYSQSFSIKKVSEDELQLSAAACVHIYGSVRKIGAFQSVIMLNRSGMDAFNRCMSRFAPADIAVMKMEAENEHSGNLQTVLYASQKEKLSELIQIFKRELGEDMVDLSHSEVSQCYLSMRRIDFTKEKVLRLRLVYKWGSEAVALDSNDFVTFSDCSTGGACLPQVKSFGLDNSLMSEDLETLSLTSVGGKFPSTSFDELQKHGSAKDGKIEYHLHQTLNQVISPQTCVIGNQATVNDQMPNQRALPEGLNCSPKRSITEGRRSLPEAEDSKDRS